MTANSSQSSIRDGVTFTDAHVLVTGGSGGIGQRIVEEFLAAGASVSILDRRRPDDPSDGEAIHEADDSAFVRVDLTDAGSVADAVADAEDAFGPVDAVVNNAGVNHLGSAHEVALERWDEVLAVNLRGAFLVARHTLPSLRERGGAIVNVASIAGLKGSASYAAYGPSKAAMINLTRQLAVDYAEDGVRVNAVAPGIIDAGMAEQELQDPEVEAYKREMTRLSRLGHPQDVANGVLFLASDLASFVTGETLVIDGGWQA